MKKSKVIFRKAITVISILALATALAFAMKDWNLRTENILLVYVGAVMLINIETRSILVGTISGFICVMFFNYFFTEPYNTFQISDPNYYVSMVIFMIVTLIVNTLSNRLQNQTILSASGEKREAMLNQINKSLLNAHSFTEISAFMESAFHSYLSREVGILMRIDKRDVLTPPNLDYSLHQEKVVWALTHYCACGSKQLAFGDSPYFYIPFRTKHAHGMEGVVFFRVDASGLSPRDLHFIDAALTSMLIACDRELTAMDKEKAQSQMEKEKFKSSLLRSISHDIKTPLTSISAGSSMLLDASENFSEEERKKILQDIYDESQYMADFVSNLLNMTKIDANRLEVQKHREVVDEILSEVMIHIGRRMGTHQLVIEKKPEVLFVDTDHQLLVQVLVNLIDNAIKHTHADTIIHLDYYVKDNSMFFEVSDNGDGLDESKMDHLFEDFVSVKAGKEDHSRGTGLGLFICNSIVKAHGGKLTALNNESGGATFRFFLPYETRGESDHE